MNTYSKDVVKKLLDKVKADITTTKDKEIENLKKELEVLKLERELNSDLKAKEEQKVIDDNELDKILNSF